jgi:hypothetical protein
LCYSQAKIELYGLFRALHAAKVWLIGLKVFTVEVDAKYICGMLKKPDIQPNAAMNRWIVGICTFDFTLKHIPGMKHLGPDRLSQWPRAEEDSDEEDLEDIDESIEEIVGCGLWLAKEVEKEQREEAMEDWHIVMNARAQDGTDIEIPSDDASKQIDEELEAIQTYLETFSFPSTTDSSHHTHLRKCAWQLFIQRNRLW